MWRHRGERAGEGIQKHLAQNTNAISLYHTEKNLWSRQNKTLWNDNYKHDTEYENRQNIMHETFHANVLFYNDQMNGNLVSKSSVIVISPGFAVLQHIITKVFNNLNMSN